jgi:hypothetical protein
VDFIARAEALAYLEAKAAITAKARATADSLREGKTKKHDEKGISGQEE